MTFFPGDRVKVARKCIHCIGGGCFDNGEVKEASPRFYNNDKERIIVLFNERFNIWCTPEIDCCEFEVNSL